MQNEIAAPAAILRDRRMARMPVRQRACLFEALWSSAFNGACQSSTGSLLQNGEWGPLGGVRSSIFNGDAVEVSLRSVTGR